MKKVGNVLCGWRGKEPHEGVFGNMESEARRNQLKQLKVVTAGEEQSRGGLFSILSLWRMSSNLLGAR